MTSWASHTRYRPITASAEIPGARSDIDRQRARSSFVGIAGHPPHASTSARRAMIAFGWNGNGARQDSANSPTAHRYGSERQCGVRSPVVRRRLALSQPTSEPSPASESNAAIKPAGSRRSSASKGSTQSPPAIAKATLRAAAIPRRAAKRTMVSGVICGISPGPSMATCHESRHPCASASTRASSWLRAASGRN